MQRPTRPLIHSVGEPRVILPDMRCSGHPTLISRGTLVHFLPQDLFEIDLISHQIDRSKELDFETFSHSFRNQHNRNDCSSRL